MQSINGLLENFNQAYGEIYDASIRLNKDNFISDKIDQLFQEISNLSIPQESIS